MIKISSLFAACVLTSSVSLAAPSPSPAPKTTPAVPVAAPTAVPTATVAAPLAVDDLDALRAQLGKTVDVRGTPTATGHSKAGTVAYLNFGPAHKALAVVAFLGGGGGAGDPAAKKVQSEDDLKAFVGKPVIIHGKLADYKGDLQIVLDSLDQMTLAPQ